MGVRWLKFCLYGCLIVVKVLHNPQVHSGTHTYMFNVNELLQKDYLHKCKSLCRKKGQETFFFSFYLPLIPCVYYLICNLKRNLKWLTQLSELLAFDSQEVFWKEKKKLSKSCSLFPQQQAYRHMVTLCPRPSQEATTNTHTQTHFFSYELKIELEKLPDWSWISLHHAGLRHTAVDY